MPRNLASYVISIPDDIEHPSYIWYSLNRILLGDTEAPHNKLSKEELCHIIGKRFDIQGLDWIQCFMPINISYVMCDPVDQIVISDSEAHAYSSFGVHGIFIDGKYFDRLASDLYRRSISNVWDRTEDSERTKRGYAKVIFSMYKAVANIIAFISMRNNLKNLSIVAQKEIVKQVIEFGFHGRVTDRDYIESCLSALEINEVNGM